MDTMYQIYEDWKWRTSKRQPCEYGQGCSEMATHRILAKDGDYNVCWEHAREAQCQPDVHVRVVPITPYYKPRKETV